MLSVLLTCNANRLREVAAFAFSGMTSNSVAAAVHVAHRARVVLNSKKRANNSSSERAEGADWRVETLESLETGRT